MLLSTELDTDRILLVAMQKCLTLSELLIADWSTDAEIELPNERCFGVVFVRDGIWGVVISHRLYY